MWAGQGKAELLVGGAWAKGGGHEPKTGKTNKTKQKNPNTKKAEKNFLAASHKQ